MLFDNFEAYDVQEIRRVSKKEGEIEGEKRREISLMRKNLKKGMDIDTIADFLKVERSYVELVNTLLEEQPDRSEEDLAKLILKAASTPRCI